MADTITAPRQAAAPELNLLVRARRERWDRERLRVELLVALPLASAEEVARLIGAVATPEASRRRVPLR